MLCSFLHAECINGITRQIFFISFPPLAWRLFVHFWYICMYAYTVEVISTFVIVLCAFFCIALPFHMLSYWIPNWHDIVKNGKMRPNKMKNREKTTNQKTHKTDCNHTSNCLFCSVLFCVAADVVCRFPFFGYYKIFDFCVFCVFGLLLRRLHILCDAQVLLPCV